ncbi:Uncharacterised protein [Mycobacteroides abscessus subsp. massiliense]|nr:Uncharacterised protein [Mycobacteroides abscessus subsp. massiliense]
MPAAASYGPAMSEKIESKSDVRRKVREAQTRAQQERIQREAANREDMVAFLLAEQKLEAVDDWERERRAQVHGDAEQRRHEQRVAGAKALARMQERGETIRDIACLGDVPEKKVRSYLKLVKQLQERSGGAVAAFLQPLGSDGAAGAADGPGPQVRPAEVGSGALGLPQSGPAAGPSDGQ